MSFVTQQGSVHIHHPANKEMITQIVSNVENAIFNAQKDAEEANLRTQELTKMLRVHEGSLRRLWVSFGISTFVNIVGATIMVLMHCKVV